LSWLAAASGAAPTTYSIEAGTAPGLANVANFATGNSATTFSAVGVPNGTYYIRVRASNAAGASTPSNQVTLVVGSPSPGAPLAPSTLTASWVGSTVTLSWLAPSGGGTPTSYIIDVRATSGSANFTSFSTGSNATTITAPNVGNGTYYVRVRASNASGASGPSNEVVVVVGADACNGNFTVTLTWNTGSASGSPFVDMDLNVTEPDGTRVYWDNPSGGRSVEMFGDNTKGLGPEIICTPGAPFDGVYAIDVVAYDGNEWPTTATIAVKVGSATVAVSQVFAGPDTNVRRRVATVAFPSGIVTPSLPDTRSAPQ
jgi:predicted phage tail protein